jgi:sec-independent protein translocase protein TatA
MSPVFGFLGSTPDLLIIAFVILLLFGNRLPSVMRSLGEGVVEFKKGIQGIEDKKDEPTSPEKKPE